MATSTLRADSPAWFPPVNPWSSSAAGIGSPPGECYGCLPAEPNETLPEWRARTWVAELRAIMKAEKAAKKAEKAAGCAAWQAERASEWASGKAWSALRAVCDAKEEWPVPALEWIPCVCVNCKCDGVYVCVCAL